MLILHGPGGLKVQRCGCRCDVVRLNNAFSNLEWCTHKYNLEYGFKFGNKARNKKGQFTHK